MLLILNLTLKFLLRENVKGIEIVVLLPAVMAGPHPSILLPYQHRAESKCMTRIWQVSIMYMTVGLYFVVLSQKQELAPLQ